MRKLALAVTLAIGCVAHAQLGDITGTKKTADKKPQIQKPAAASAQNIHSSPQNPLLLDKAFLSDFAAQLGDGQLKNTLESYINNIGTDNGLSYRQIYWDVLEGFSQQPSLAKNPNFASIDAGLNTIFNNPAGLPGIIPQTGDTHFGQFLNDPDMMHGLTNVTGSYESAQAVGAGIEIVNHFSEVIAAEQRYKEDYRKLAKISVDHAYVEKDDNIRAALIDAYVGIEGQYYLSPIYRYDFANGASLRVENGILKYFNPSKNIVKELCTVQKRHDLQYYSGNKDVGGYIKIAPDESTFMLHNEPNIRTDAKCKNCLHQGAHIIDSETGQVLYEKDGALIPNIRNIASTYYDESGDVVMPDFFAAMGYFRTVKRKFKANVSKDEKGMYGERYLDRDKNFVFNGVATKFRDDNSMQASIFARNIIQQWYPIDKDGQQLNFFFGSHAANGSQRYSSSMVQIANTSKDNKTFNTDAMVNELTGMAIDKDKNLYFISASGKIGRLKASEYRFDDPNFAAQLRKQLNKKVAADYNFVAGKDFTTVHGGLDVHQAYPILPMLRFTPDQKWLVYTVQNHLYLINPENFDTKSFDLSVQPYNLFFAKENNDYTITVQAQNDFMFPVAKKYSIAKLASATMAKPSNVPAKTPPAKKVPTAKPQAASSPQSGFSVADEIKKLKELLDSGAINQNEYEAAKSQLLGKPNPETSKGSGALNEVPTKENRKWYFIQSDKALRESWTKIKQEGDLVYLKMHVFLDTDDQIMCEDCKGYVWYFSYDTGIPEQKIKLNLVFERTYSKIYTVPQTIVLRLKKDKNGQQIWDEAAQKLKFDDKKGEPLDLQIGWSCVDDFNDQNSKLRCDTFDWSQAEVLR